jgi:hypothetical protein
LHLVSVVFALADQTSRNGLHYIGTALDLVSHRKSGWIHDVLGDSQGTSSSFAPLDEMSFEDGLGHKPRAMTGRTIHEQ